METHILNHLEYQICPDSGAQCSILYFKVENCTIIIGGRSKFDLYYRLVLIYFTF
jgi:hypothetical protein